MNRSPQNQQNHGPNAMSRETSVKQDLMPNSRDKLLAMYNKIFGILLSRILPLSSHEIDDFDQVTQAIKNCPLLKMKTILFHVAGVQQITRLLSFGITSRYRKFRFIHRCPRNIQFSTQTFDANQTVWRGYGEDNSKLFDSKLSHFKMYHLIERVYL